MKKMENIAPEFTDEDFYAEIMSECLEQSRKYHKADVALKERYKRTLKPLIDTYVLWRYLNENMECWKPEGIYSLTIANKMNSYYGRVMPHAKVQYEEHKYLDLHWQQESTKEYGANHVFIQQWCHYEDSYSGYIAIPLRNRKYFLISYSA